MIAAAVYARKSNEQTGVADDAKSVARQIAHARAYAKAKGWTVADEHVFADDGVSGALFGSKRPGLARLLNALSPRPPFQVLVMMEEARLGREQIELAWTLKQLVEAGCRVFFYLDDTERTLDTALEKVMLSLTGFAAEMEREKARQRTHDALLRKARTGHVVGGLVFGYQNRPIFDGTRRSHVERVIEDREAGVVRRIFQLAADGWGVKRIAAALNETGAPAPLPRRRGRPAGWAPSSVREVLRRDLYRGVIVWNRTARIVRHGARAQRDRPAADVVTLDAPALAIVDPGLWTAAQERMRASAAIYRERTGGRSFGRPANGVESPYLLTGLGSCALCGGSMAVLTRAHGSRGHIHRRAFYGCMTRKLRGRAICGNVLEVPLDAADASVLAAIEHDVLHVEIIETALAKALASLAAANARAPEPRLAELREEAARIEAEVGRLAQAIATGGSIPALVAVLQERERRRVQLHAELAAVERPPAPRRDADDRGRILGIMRDALADWQGMLRRETGPARQALRALLVGRLVFTPQERGRERFYTFEGAGTISPVIAGAAKLQKVWWPQRDSNPCFSHDHVFASIFA